MNPAGYCEHCNAELRSIDAPCPRCSLLSSSAQEDRWSKKLPQLRNITKMAFAVTVVLCLWLVILDWKEGLAVLSLTALQVWVYSYYGQRIGNQDASLPGPVTVQASSKLSTRIDWDLWAMVFVALPAAGALLMLAKHTLFAAQ